MPKPRLSQSISAAAWPFLNSKSLLLLLALSLSLSASETLHAHEHVLSLAIPIDLCMAMAGPSRSVTGTQWSVKHRLRNRKAWHQLQRPPHWLLGEGCAACLPSSLGLLAGRQRPASLQAPAAHSRAGSLMSRFAVMTVKRRSADVHLQHFIIKAGNPQCLYLAAEGPQNWVVHPHSLRR